MHASLSGTCFAFKKCVIASGVLTHDFRAKYMRRSAFNTLPSIPVLINLNHNNKCGIASNAFEKSTNNT